MLSNIRTQCPYCGERIEVLVDASAGGQRYIEDCQVCCRPITIEVSLDRDGDPRVATSTEHET